MKFSDLAKESKVVVLNWGDSCHMTCPVCEKGTCGYDASYRHGDAEPYEIEYYPCPVCGHRPEPKS